MSAGLAHLPKSLDGWISGAGSPRIWGKGETGVSSKLSFGCLLQLSVHPPSALATRHPQCRGSQLQRGKDPPHPSSPNPPQQQLRGFYCSSTKRWQRGLGFLSCSGWSEIGREKKSLHRGLELQRGPVLGAAEAPGLKYVEVVAPHSSGDVPERPGLSGGAWAETGRCGCGPGSGAVSFLRSELRWAALLDTSLRRSVFLLSIINLNHWISLVELQF